MQKQEVKLTDLVRHWRATTGAKGEGLVGYLNRPNVAGGRFTIAEIRFAVGLVEADEAKKFEEQN